MAFPDWLPIEYPGVFDPNQVIDDALPVPFSIGYGERGSLGSGEVINRLMGSVEVEHIEHGPRFEYNLIHHRTHAMGMIDMLDVRGPWTDCAAGIDPDWDDCQTPSEIDWAGCNDAGGTPI